MEISARLFFFWGGVFLYVRKYEACSYIPIAISALTE